MIEHRITEYIGDNYDGEFFDNISSLYIKVKQNDYGIHRFIFTPLNDCNCCVIKFNLPNGNVVVSDKLIITDDVFIYDVDNAVLSCAGKVIGEISFYSEDFRISSAKFYFEVVEEINADDAIEDNDKLPILESLINDVKSVKNVSTEGVAKKDYSIFGEEGNKKLVLSMSHNEIARIDEIYDVISIDEFIITSNGFEEANEKHLKIHTSEIVFTTSADTEFTLNLPENTYLLGRDVDENIFVPQLGMRYSILFWYDGESIVGCVSGYSKF